MEEPTNEEIAEKYRETAELFRGISQDLLRGFIFVEEKLKEAAQACQDLAEMLDPPENTTNTFEGDINVN